MFADHSSPGASALAAQTQKALKARTSSVMTTVWGGKKTQHWKPLHHISINYDVAVISVPGLKELLETTGNMLTEQKVLLERRFSWACGSTALAEVGWACDTWVIKAGTPPGNLEGSVTCPKPLFL